MNSREVGTTEAPDTSTDGWKSIPYQIPKYVVHNRRNTTMFYTIAVVLVVLWLLGMVTSYTMGGFIHLLLVLAIIAILVRVISGRRLV